MGPLAGQVVQQRADRQLRGGLAELDARLPRGIPNAAAAMISFRFLPVFSGRIVESPAVTERFLWDLRRTIADLFAENYSGTMAALAHRHGMLYSVEPYGDCPSDDLQYGSYADIPMSEFWAGPTAPAMRSWRPRSATFTGASSSGPSRSPPRPSRASG